MEDINELKEKLKGAVNSGDNEAAHVYFDEILELIVKECRPELYEELENIRGGMSFWYA